MFKLRSLLIFSLGFMGVSTPVMAQNSAVSPVLLLESVPSDNPNYRRMVFTKYLRGDQVMVNYKSYNRSEFIQVSPQTPVELIHKCTRGPATGIGELQSFERIEAQRARSGQPPEVVRFCIKNVPNWNEATRERYIGPIFNGMPPAPITQ